MLKINNKKVTILGAKRSGMALAKLVLRLKGKPKISEEGPLGNLTEEFREWLAEEDIEFEVSGHSRGFIENSHFVVMSPAVPKDAHPLQWAKNKGIPVLGEVEFASQFCSKPIIAVTGSNGKTTVVTLIKEVLEEAGYSACLCGNVGYPFSDYVCDLEDKDYVVLEVSSFQLESIGKNGFKPAIAVFLNFSENHLDRHKDLAEYFQAKERIFLNQDNEDYAVLNYQDNRMREMASDINSNVCYFNAFSDESGTAEDPNQLAVVEVARILGIKNDVCQKVFERFKGVEHRCEKVTCIEGIDFVNDSKATTVEASRWALEHIDQPIVMICGGRDKNMNYSVLANTVKKKVRRMFVIGEAKQKIKKSFGSVIDVEECPNLKSAVKKAKDFASSGDCVLLSPMCASFDMFEDFQARGKIFKEIVHKLETNVYA